MGLLDYTNDFYYDSYHDIITNSSFFRPKLRLVFDEKKEQNAFGKDTVYRIEEKAST